eukprot:3090786-Prymnesium_polylepis.1
MSKYVSNADAALLKGDELIAEVEVRKKRGNEHFARGDLNASTIAWLTAIWLLKINRPGYSEDLSQQMAPSDSKAVALLGRGHTVQEAVVSNLKPRRGPNGFLGLGVPTWMVA